LTGTLSTILESGIEKEMGYTGILYDQYKNASLKLP
jgi:hypothetical protein